VISTPEHDADEHRFEPSPVKWFQKIIFLQQHGRENLLVNAEILKTEIKVFYGKTKMSNNNIKPKDS